MQSTHQLCVMGSRCGVGFITCFLPRKLWAQKALRACPESPRTEWLSLGPQSPTADTHPPSHPQVACLHTHVEIRGPQYSHCGWKRATFASWDAVPRAGTLRSILTQERRRLLLEPNSAQSQQSRESSGRAPLAQAQQGLQRRESSLLWGEGWGGWPKGPAPTSGGECTCWVPCTVRETWPPLPPGAVLCTTRRCVGRAWSEKGGP